MKGGVVFTLGEDDFQRIMHRFETEKYLPIVSQKHSICVSDTLLLIIWYVDGIRDHFWNTYIHGKRIDTNCESNVLELNTGEILDCLFQVSGARVANLLKTHPVINPLVPLPVSGPTSMYRTESAPLSELRVSYPTRPHLAVGQVCSLIYNTYLVKKGVQGSSIPTGDSFYTVVSTVRTILGDAITKMGIGDRYSLVESRAFGSEVIAIFLAFRVDHTYKHVSALCKINSHWYYLDNEIGYALPILHEFDHDEILTRTTMRVNIHVSGSEEFRSLHDITTNVVISEIGRSKSSPDGVSRTFEEINYQRFLICKLPPPLVRFGDLPTSSTGFASATVTSQRQEPIPMETDGGARKSRRRRKHRRKTRRTKHKSSLK
jgi:hypothetical protein